MLSLAIREWLYCEFKTLDVGALNILEIALVNNETLSYLTVCGDLHKGAIQYSPNTDLGDRIDTYVKCVENCEGGLWGMSPPKCLADVTEALIGAVHMEGDWKFSKKTVHYIYRHFMQILKALSPEALKEATISLVNPKQRMYVFSLIHFDAFASLPYPRNLLQD